MHSKADYTVTTSIEKSAFLSASLIYWLMVTTKKYWGCCQLGDKLHLQFNAKKCKYMVLSRKGWALNLMRSYAMEFLLKESQNSSTLASTFLLIRLGHHNSAQSARRPVLTFKPAYCYMSHTFDPILNIRCMPGIGSSSHDQKGYWSTGVSSEIFTESMYQTMGHA